jgi:hypothetical protein
MDFVLTIDSDQENVASDSEDLLMQSTSHAVNPIVKKKKGKKARADHDVSGSAPSFVFGLLFQIVNYTHKSIS